MEQPENESSSVAHFAGLRVASLESRRAEDMTRLITRHGGEAFVSPSMREVPIKPNRAAIDFAYRVMTGQVGIVILLTGVGFRFLLSAIEESLDRQKFLDALSDITTIVRGPKPAAAMKEVGLTPTYRVAEPNTWRELLQLIDREVPVSNVTVGLQEYGITNASLIAGLEARGATVESVRVYGWDFPTDEAPLEANVRAIAAGQRDVLMFTSAHQVVNMLRMAERLQIVEDLRRSLRSTVIASIGPTTSQMLEESDILVDVEPTHPRWDTWWSNRPSALHRFIDSKTALLRRLSLIPHACSCLNSRLIRVIKVFSCELVAANLPSERRYGSCAKRAATWKSIARFAHVSHSWSSANRRSYAAK